MEIHALSLSNKDSQWLESRQLSAAEICRYFGVPPQMIGVKMGATARDSAEQGLNFLKYTLTPLAARFELRANLSLIGDPEKYFTKFNLDAMERSVTKDRYEAHNMSLQGGWQTVNEVRSLEDLNPIEGGDELQSPLNMQPLGGGPDENEQGGRPGKGTPKPPQQPEAPDDAEPTANTIDRDNQRRAARASFAVLLDEAAQRIAAAEIKALSVRADKAAEDHDKWCDWVIGVYDKHGTYIAKTVTPICEAWAVANPAAPSPEQVTKHLLGTGTVLVVCEGTDMLALLDEWKRERAGTLAKTLKEEFFNENL